MDRMTQALEAAKQAQERGADVTVARKALKEARAAFDPGNYVAAMKSADYILRLFGTSPAPAPPSPSMIDASVAGRLANLDAPSARGWLDQATRSVQEAKARGLNVHVAKAALAQAKKAFKGSNYRSAIEFANQAIQLCASATPAQR